jgi:hypothetical protein
MCKHSLERDLPGCKAQGMIELVRFFVCSSRETKSKGPSPFLHLQLPIPPGVSLRNWAAQHGIALHESILHSGGILACRTHKLFPLYRNLYLKTAAADGAAVVAML